jgi:uncharacterized protein (DUF1778 family)
MNASAAPKQPPSREPVRRVSVVNLRVPRAVRDLIDSAAAVLGKTRTDFIIDSSRRHAVDVLLDQRLFTLSEEQYDTFRRALDAPPAPNAKLKRLMASKSPWET